MTEVGDVSLTFLKTGRWWRPFLPHRCFFCYHEMRVHSQCKPLACWCRSCRSTSVSMDWASLVYWRFPDWWRRPKVFCPCPWTCSFARLDSCGFPSSNYIVSELLLLHSQSSSWCSHNTTLGCSAFQASGCSYKLSPVRCHFLLLAETAHGIFDEAPYPAVLWTF